MAHRPRSSSPAVCSALYVLDANFKRLLHRDWRGDSVPAHVDAFAAHLNDTETESELKPVFHDPDLGVTFVWIRHADLYFLAVSKQNANATALLCFLHALIKVLTHYFQTLEEESVRDNFVIIYELLDEVCDNGYPQFTEAKILSEFIKTGKYFPTPNPASTFAHTRLTLSFIYLRRAPAGDRADRPDGRHERGELALGGCSVPEKRGVS